MQINNRQEDLSKVFDRQWKANHNDDIKNIKEKERSFMNKMFNVKETPSNNNIGFKPLTQAEQLQRRQNNMNSMNNYHNNTKLNNFKGRMN